ncbi:MAG: pyruvate kinase [Verrucomicrobia subdivision 3 bacterium]|nr:pyruvate kinase [Limisphaerales bacterium]
MGFGKNSLSQFEQIRRPNFKYSAFNLACYLALRRRDIRDLQQALVPLGLSSLGRCEAHVLANLDAVISALAMMSAVDKKDRPGQPSLKHFVRGGGMIERNAARLFGKPSRDRRVRIMVTLSAEVAQDYRWVRDLLRRGADCVRINCAHDSEAEWTMMIRNVRRAARQEDCPCPVLMDLTGPRARTVQVQLASPERRVRKGERILLLSEPTFDFSKIPFQAVCSLQEIVPQLQVGAAVMFNDGKIGATVAAAGKDSVQLQVFQARDKGERFRSDMGLNFPDTFVKVDPLTPKDLSDLDFICRHAELVGYSFVQEPADMDRIVEEIRRRGAARIGKRPLGVIAKIETARAVRNLPELIVRGAGHVPFGVMIARGDLAVEIGYLRIAEIQEEILWICEAAHAPVIWATQVLENFAKKGVPSRAEITDAAMSERSDCVMLNKGPFIPETVAILDQVLVRMQAHLQKKRPTLRVLHSWDHLWRGASHANRPFRDLRARKRTADAVGSAARSAPKEEAE